MNAAVAISVDPSKVSKVQRMIEVSHNDPIDYERSIDWKLGVDRSLPPKLPEHGWLYGTPFYDRLTPEQAHELLWLETARDVTMFLTLERALPPLYTGYANRYEDEIAPEIVDYLLIFSREEITHTLMFKRYQRLAGLPHFSLESIMSFFRDQLPLMPPVAGILMTLLIEWIAELGALSNTQHDGVDPLTRQLFRRHHVDEARHIAFARWVVESQFDSMPEEQVQPIREVARQQFKRLMLAYTYNEEVARFTSFPYPVGLGDISQIRAVRFSAHNQELNRKRFAPMTAWLEKVGIL
jgi:hypothetical protein